MKTDAFVKTWQGAEDVDEVARAAGCSASAARSRASSLRKKGIPLKMFSVRGRPVLDVDGLTALAEKSR